MEFSGTLIYRGARFFERANLFSFLRARGHGSRTIFHARPGKIQLLFLASFLLLASSFLFRAAVIFQNRNGSTNPARQEAFPFQAFLRTSSRPCLSHACARTLDDLEYILSELEQQFRRKYSNFWKFYNKFYGYNY